MYNRCVKFSDEEFRTQIDYADMFFIPESHWKEDECFNEITGWGCFNAPGVG